MIIRACPVEIVKGEAWERFRDRHGDCGRDMVLWLARQRSGLTLRELGGAVGGLDYRSVSSAIRRMNREVHANRRLRHTVNKAMRHLQNNEICDPNRQKCHGRQGCAEPRVKNEHTHLGYPGSPQVRPPKIFSLKITPRTRSYPTVRSFLSGPSHLRMWQALCADEFYRYCIRQIREHAH